MKVNFEQIDLFLVARVRSASLDVGNAREFKDDVAAAAGERHRLLILDLSAVQEIDSAGLGALVAILKWVRRWKGSLHLCGIQSSVREVVELAMLHRVLPLHESVEDAMRAEAGQRVACPD